MPLITLDDGRQFEAGDNESLLDAALRADVALEHSCRTGRCSSCKARTEGDTTVALHDETGLTEQERAEGWILACVRRATGDTVLHAKALGTMKVPPARTLACRIQSLDRLAPDVLRVVLRLPPNGSFSFLPGQYVDVIGPGGVRRSYSMASAPAPDNRIELHVREVPDGVLSRYWFQQAKENDLLRLNGPRGTFVLQDAAGLDLVFLATGTGIAPVKAMLEGLHTLPPAERPASVTLYWGGRVATDLYWRPDERSGTVRFVPVLSRAAADWSGARGHVQQVLLANAPALDRTLVYACGSDAMIHAARSTLTAAGLPGDRFHADAFVCSAPA
ncbi:NAD(P)H-flavin reductase [Rubrivivax gelatinosus]|nr:NAD(P)H-flavin reductase [Rubrivivax gelatinosus]